MTELRDTTMDEMMATGSGRSLWVGERAVLDVARAAVNLKGQSYGLLQDGGSITLGGVVNVAKGNVAAPDLFIVLRPGSRLDASGASASLLANGAPVAAASAGGLIAISSANGLYLDGQMIARSGGAGRRRLALGLDTPEYKSSAIQDRVKAPRDFVLSDKATAGLPAALDNPATAADKLAYGHATLGADQLEQGGFGALDLLSNGLLSFAGDVTLNLGQSLRLFSGPRHDARCRADGARSAGRALHHAGRRHRRQ